MFNVVRYYDKNHKIEVHKPLFGKEKVLINGIVYFKNRGSHREYVSRTSKKEYSISIDNGSEESSFEVKNNGDPVPSVNNGSNTSLFLLSCVIIGGLSFGFSFGFVCHNFLWPILFQQL